MPDFQAWPLAANATMFAVAAIIVLLAGIRLTGAADRLADMTGLGEALIGAVILGAVTSLSGSIASITAALSGAPSLAVSNAVGGIAAQTVFLIIADLSYRGANLEHAAASLTNLISGCMLVVLLNLILIAQGLPQWTLAWIHPTTPVLLLFYVGGLVISYRSKETPMWAPVRTLDTRADVPEPMPPGGQSLPQLLVSILFLGTIVAGAGWFIAKTGLALSVQLGIAEGLVGALLTATATSTPELVTTLAAVRRGALTLAVGGILGGNTFDVLFIAFSDIAYLDGSIYHAMEPRQNFLIALTTVMTGVLMVGLLQRERRGPVNIGVEGIIVLALYILGVLTMIFAFP